MPGQGRASGCALSRLVRLAMMPNVLRRATDRIEAAVVALLSAALLAAVIAAPYVGERFYQWQRAEAAQLHPAVAVLSQAGPQGNSLTWVGAVSARWRAPDGGRRSGMLSTLTAPGISGASAGARVPIWLTGSGDPAIPPVGQAGAALNAVMISVAAVLGAGTVLIICYGLCRLALDRRRLTAWESAWTLTGPRWTRR